MNGASVSHARVWGANRRRNILAVRDACGLRSAGLTGRSAICGLERQDSEKFPNQKKNKLWKVSESKGEATRDMKFSHQSLRKSFAQAQAQINRVSKLDYKSIE